MPDAALCDTIATLHKHLNRLQAVWSHHVAVAHERGAVASEGYASTAAFLRRMCHLSPGAARHQLRTATALAERPRISELFDEGAVSSAHVGVLTAALDQLPATLAADAEPVLLEAATQYDPARLAQIARRLRLIADPDGAADRDIRHHEARWLDVSATLDGMVALSGLLDAESGAVLRTWLDAATPPPAPDDTRTGAQRRADALVQLARAALDNGQLSDTGTERPHLLVTVDLATLQGRSSTPAELAWAGPIGGEAARRLACDAAATRIITSNHTRTAFESRLWEALPAALRGPTQILDVGRAGRSVPSAIRKALIIRDKGCAFPGCDRPPPWCDAHHVVHWADGGATALPNLVLLCRRHHTTVHHHGWQIDVCDDGHVEFTRTGRSP